MTLTVSERKTFFSSHKGAAFKAIVLLSAFGESSKGVMSSQITPWTHSLTQL